MVSLCTKAPAGEATADVCTNPRKENPTEESKEKQGERQRENQEKQNATAVEQSFLARSIDSESVPTFTTPQHQIGFCPWKSRPCEETLCWMPSCMIFSVKDCPQRRAVGGSCHCTKKQSGHELMSTIRQELHLKCSRLQLLRQYHLRGLDTAVLFLETFFGFAPTMFAVYVCRSWVDSFPGSGRVALIMISAPYT